MKRILFVASINPFKTGGGSQATLAYLDSVLEIFGINNVDVMIASECIIPPAYQDINYIKIQIRRRLEKIHQYLLGFLSRFTMPLINYISNYSNDYSLCIINGGVVAGKSVEIIKRYGIKTVIIHHNHEVEYHFDNKSIESLKGRFMYFIKKTEAAAFLNSDLNLFLTNDDINTFCSLYGKPKGECFLLGCYEMKRAKAVILNSEKKYSLTISGTLANHQTTVGVKDFYEKYFNVAKKLIPNLTILLTGRSPSEEILTIQSNNPTVINIIPNPEDIFTVVQLGHIYLCPTNIGGGLKLRVMDGLKCNLPVLVHSVSARGYDFYYDKPYFKIYNDESSFENGLKSLFEYLNNNNQSHFEIQKDYYHYFGFNQGTKRMREALSLIDFSIRNMEIGLY